MNDDSDEWPGKHDPPHPEPEEFIPYFTGEKEIQFIKGLENTNRVGVKDLLNWIEGTDFFRAPASSNGHNNYAGGLLDHTLKVYYNLCEIVRVSGYLNIPHESLIISSFCHDLCKANFYLVDSRNKKDKQTGKWDTEPYYSIDDKLPLGHGEISVIIVQQFMTLTPNEIMAIRWHMGGFDDSAMSYGGRLALTKAFKEYPLVSALHVADLLACYPDDKGREGR